MKLYLKTYWRFLVVNLAEFHAYRMNLINTLISSLTWGIFSIIGPLLLTSRVSIVAGWKREDLLILVAAQSVLVGIYDCIFGRNLNLLPRYSELGQLDSFLLKPINEQFFISLQKINYGSLLRSLIGVLFFLYLVFSYKTQLTISGLFIAGLSLLMGLLTLYGIWFMAMTLTVWFPRISNISDLLYTLRGITRYPEQIIREVSIYVFILFFPLTFVASRPSAILLQKLGTDQIFLCFGVMVVVLFLSRKFWLYALRSYTSASS
ncbi:MAG TPA: ABC-2 family transporter protein [Patescibacteria group bacterium]|nr:ABC-2 family transporter protein [Patescibacteria group bacterium]